MDEKHNDDKSPSYDELMSIISSKDQEIASKDKELDSLKRRNDILSTRNSQFKALNSPKGIGKSKDTSLKSLYNDRNFFAATFNGSILKDHPISPENLIDQDTTEVGKADDIWLQMIRDGAKAYVEPFDDELVGAKLLRIGQHDYMLLTIFANEHQMNVDYRMPYRNGMVKFLNYGQQIRLIEKQNEKDINDGTFTPTPDADQSGERLSKFKKTDRIVRVITLTIYYGEKPWDGPRSLEDMYVDSGIPDLGEHNPLHLIDACHLTEEEWMQFPDIVKPLFGVLFNQNDPNKLKKHIRDNKDVYKVIDSSVIDALKEIASSKVLSNVLKELEETNAENNAEKAIGGDDVVNGIDAYVENERKVAAREAAQNERVNSLFTYVQDGDMLLSRAAKRMNMTDEQFKTTMIDHGYKVPEQPRV